MTVDMFDSSRAKQQPDHAIGSQWLTVEGRVGAFANRLCQILWGLVDDQAQQALLRAIRIQQ